MPPLWKMSSMVSVFAPASCGSCETARSGRRRDDVDSRKRPMAAMRAFTLAPEQRFFSGKVYTRRRRLRRCRAHAAMARIPHRGVRFLRARIQPGPSHLMNSELQKLIDLQQVDSRIAALKAEVAALPKPGQQIEAKLAGSKALVDEPHAAMKADESSRRKYESEIQDQQQKISKYRDQSLG